MQKLQLFKERITLTNYDELIKELSTAIDEGTETLTKLLFGTETPDLYENHGKYQIGQHSYCSGLNSPRFTEKRLCKCMYYLNNSKYDKSCDKCEFLERYKIEGDYTITDYEVPAFYFGEGIGEIDLIISDGDVQYAMEIKPYKGNSETLLRMISEIMTYTEGNSLGTYKKAIGFFEINRQNGKKTKQQKEYDNANPELMNLLKKADITVFQFKEIGDKEYQICKL